MDGILRRDLLEYVTVNCADEPGIPQAHSAFAWYPVDAPLPGVSVGVLTPLGCALFYRLGRRLERSVPSVHQLPYIPSLDEVRIERGLISCTMGDMELIADGMVPPWMADADAKIIPEILLDRIERSLLAFQKESRFSSHCLLCQNPAVHAPRTCKQSFLLIVAIMRYGPYSDAVGAHVSILPPMRDFDPPTYVTLLFNLAGIVASRSHSFSYSCSFQYPLSSLALYVEIELWLSSRLCQLHHDKFADLLYRIVTFSGRHKLLGSCMQSPASTSGVLPGDA